MTETLPYHLMIATLLSRCIRHHNNEDLKNVSFKGIKRLSLGIERTNLNVYFTCQNVYLFTLGAESGAVEDLLLRGDRSGYDGGRRGDGEQS